MERARNAARPPAAGTTGIPCSRQEISAADVEAVLAALKTGRAAEGTAVETFEEAIARYCGVRYAVAVSSGTAALHIACLAAGLGPGDRLWTSPMAFVSSANCGLYCGASIDFIDIDRPTGLMSIKALSRKLEESAARRVLPWIVIPVHFAGQSCAMADIGRLARQYGFTVIEDASHALGGRYRDARVGACTFSDMAVLSFRPATTITTGEGGMVLTNREDLGRKLIQLRSHGITCNPLEMEGRSHGPWHYQQVDLGFNFRMTDIQAALGRSQARRMDEFVGRRRELAGRYDRLLEDLPLARPSRRPDADSSYHFYVVRLRRDALRKTRRRVFEELRDRGVGVEIHYLPVHLHPYYQRLGFQEGDFPEAETFYEEAMTLPLYCGLSERDQDAVVEALREALR